MGDAHNPEHKPLPECLTDALIDPNRGTTYPSEDTLEQKALAPTTPPPPPLVAEATAVFEILGVAGGQQFLALLLLKGFKIARCNAMERRVVADAMNVKPKKPPKGNVLQIKLPPR